MLISSKAIKAAVIGNPISHSLSPKIHNFLLEKHQIDGVYLALKIEKNDLAICVDSLVKMGFAGFNVTVPHKEEIFKLCDYTSNTAKLCKAVNTVIVTQDKKLFGHNSDAEGFINHFKNCAPDFDFPNKNIFVIGAGGAARAAVYSLIKAKSKKIFITNRNQNRAEELIKDFADFAAEKKCELEFLDAKNFEKKLDICDLLVNSTTLGMHGQEPLRIDLKHLNKNAIVYDIVYKPLMTELLTVAQSRGNKIITGVGMLLNQALIGFESWFKQKPDEKFLIEILEDLES
ncbi:MAG: shikimate dehydrogenase [Pseudomonadota bacterium]